MEKPTAIKKIERHWTEYMLSKGENPLKHALRSYQEWYQIHMTTDPEIDQYYDQIYSDQHMTLLNQRIAHLDLVEYWVTVEREEIHRMINEANPYN